MSRRTQHRVACDAEGCGATSHAITYDHEVPDGWTSVDVVRSGSKDEALDLCPEHSGRVTSALRVLRQGRPSPIALPAAEELAR